MPPTSSSKQESVIEDLLAFEKSEQKQLERLHTQLDQNLSKERKKDEEELQTIKTKISEAETHAKTSALEKIKEDARTVKKTAEAQRKEWLEQAQKNRKMALKAARTFIRTSMKHVAY